MNYENLTYVYKSGRIKRLNGKETYPDEFFYGLNFLSSKFKNTSVIELEENKSNIFFKNYFNLIRYISGLPFYSEQIISRKNFKILKNSDLIVLTNQGLGFSALPLILINKLFKKQVSCVFVMGLYNVNTNKKIKLLFRKFFTFIFLKTIDKIIFLSQGEYNFSVQKYSKLASKFSSLPFCIDTEFWNPSLGKDKLKNNILFIGNDGMRDYDFAIELAKNMENYNFTFITNKIEKSNLKSNNIELINGFWSEETLSDIEIKNIYENSLLTIIPIVETLQPSGQSVALQSMSLGVPVIITKTNGFWEPKKFIDKENIIFVEKNNITQWKNKINHILSDKEFYEKLSKSAKKTVNENNNLNLFNKNLIKILLN